MLGSCGGSHLIDHAPSVRSRFQTLFHHTRLSLPAAVRSGVAIQLKLASAPAWCDQPVLPEGEMSLS